MFSSLLYVCIARLERKSAGFLRGFRTEGGRWRLRSQASSLALISFLLEGFPLADRSPFTRRAVCFGAGAVCRAAGRRTAVWLQLRAPRRLHKLSQRHFPALHSAVFLHRPVCMLALPAITLSLCVSVCVVSWLLLT